MRDPEFRYTPYGVYGTRSLWPLEELVSSTGRTIERMWAEAGGGEYRPQGALNLPVVATIELRRHRDKQRPGHGSLRMDVYSIVLAQWIPSKRQDVMLGSLWLSDKVPKLRSLRIKRFSVETPALRWAWVCHRPRPEAVTRTAIDLAEGIALRKGMDDTCPVAIAVDGWRRSEWSGTRRWPPFYPPAGHRMALYSMPTARKLAGAGPADASLPWSEGQLADADRESIYRDRAFIRRYLQQGKAPAGQGSAQRAA